MISIILFDETSVFFSMQTQTNIRFTQLVFFFILFKPFSLQLRVRDFFWGHEQFEDAFVSDPVMAAMDFCLSAFPTIQGQSSMGFLPFFFWCALCSSLSSRKCNTRESPSQQPALLAFSNTVG